MRQRRQYQVGYKMPVISDFLLLDDTGTELLVYLLDCKDSSEPALPPLDGPGEHVLNQPRISSTRWSSSLTGNAKLGRRRRGRYDIGYTTISHPRRIFANYRRKSLSD